MLSFGGKYLNLSKPSWLKFPTFNFSQNVTCPFYCGERRNCKLAKLVPAGTIEEPGGNSCCPYPEQPTYVDYIEFAAGCDDPGYQCSLFDYRIRRCPSGVGCVEAIVEDCQDVPDSCVDEDGDGYYAESPACPPPFGNDCNDNPNNNGEDINPGKSEDCDLNSEDENCDGLTNCEDSECRKESEENECDAQCDKDGDGYYSQACAGGDCKDDPEEEPNAENIFPGQDKENTAALCDDGLNNDCDDLTDCLDADSCRNGPTNFCPQCVPEEVCVPGTGDEDCNGFEDCEDLPNNCESHPACQGTPTPTPTATPGGGDDGGGDPCQGDECCGRGTHTECTEGECEPSVEICSDVDPYDNIPPVCETYPAECEPETCFEVCN